jgi:hypothetical protein
MHFDNEKLIEKDLFTGGKSSNFKGIVSKFFDCFMIEHKEDSKA